MESDVKMPKKIFSTSKLHAKHTIAHQNIQQTGPVISRFQLDTGLVCQGWNFHTCTNSLGAVKSKAQKTMF